MAGLQLRYETGLTGEEYVRTEAWREARLARCPNHPHGGCSVCRHGTYERKTPPGAKVPRWYCRESHTTEPMSYFPQDVPTIPIHSSYLWFLFGSKYVADIIHTTFNIRESVIHFL